MKKYIAMMIVMVLAQFVLGASFNLEMKQKGQSFGPFSDKPGSAVSLGSAVFKLHFAGGSYSLVSPSSKRKYGPFEMRDGAGFMLGKYSIVVRDVQGDIYATGARAPTGSIDDPVQSDVKATTVDGLNIAVTEGQTVVYGAGQYQAAVYVRCEIKNVGNQPKDVLCWGRLYSISSDGKELRWPRRGEALPFTRTLKQGESTHWWQHGQAPKTGSHNIFIKWETNSELCSAPVKCGVAKTKAMDQQSRREHIVQWDGKIPEITPNTKHQKASFTEVKFTSPPLSQKGKMFNVFKYRVDKGKDHVAAWSILTGDAKSRMINNIMVTTASGQPVSLLVPKLKLLTDDYGGTVKKGEQALFQCVPRDLKDSTYYYVWLGYFCQPNEGTMVSMNVIGKKLNGPDDLFVEWKAPGISPGVELLGGGSGGINFVISRERITK